VSAHGETLINKRRGAGEQTGGEIAARRGNSFGGSILLLNNRCIVRGIVPYLTHAQHALPAAFISNSGV